MLNICKTFVDCQRFLMIHEPRLLATEVLMKNKLSYVRSYNDQWLLNPPQQTINCTEMKNSDTEKGQKLLLSFWCLNFYL